MSDIRRNTARSVRARIMGIRGPSALVHTATGVSGSVVGGIPTKVCLGDPLRFVTMNKRPVRLFVSDPWEFGTECGSGPFGGAITDANDENMLVRLSSPICYKGRIFYTAIAAARHEGHPVTPAVTKPVSVNLIFLPDAGTSLGDISEATMKRGLPAIGTIESQAV